MIAAGWNTTHAQQRLTDDVARDAASARFVYADVENFIQTHRKIREGGDPDQLLQAGYLDKASPGLGMFIRKYDLTVNRLKASMQKHPEKYAAIESNLAVLRDLEPAFRKAYAEMQDLVPGAVFPPTYFVVAGHRGIGSGSTEGPLISIEKETAASMRADLVATLVHEMMHMEQLAILGEDYFKIFGGPERTLLATSVREGIATYFSELITGGSEHKNKAQAFLEAHERRLWNAFKKEMHSGEMGEWLWSKPSDPEQPQDIGYAIGARIARSYYERAADKRKAVREILGVTDYPAFLAASGYEESLGD